MFVYSLFNRKTAVYQDPYIQPIAKDIYPKIMSRSVIMNPDEATKNHVYECELYYLGTFDEQTCMFDLLEKPEFLCTFANLEPKEDVKIN